MFNLIHLQQITEKVIFCPCSFLSITYLCETLLYIYYAHIIIYLKFGVWLFCWKVYNEKNHWNWAISYFAYPDITNNLKSMPKMKTILISLFLEINSRDPQNEMNWAKITFSCKDFIKYYYNDIVGFGKQSFCYIFNVLVNFVWPCCYFFLKCMW